jgi:hypothetical protein
MLLQSPAVVTFKINFQGFIAPKKTQFYRKFYNLVKFPPSEDKKYFSFT